MPTEEHNVYLLAATVDTDSNISWRQCELIECIPVDVPGHPLVRGTRSLPNAIAGSYYLGETIYELHKGFSSLSVA